MRIERSPLCQQQPSGCMVAAHRGAGEAIDTHRTTPYAPHKTMPYICTTQDNSICTTPYAPYKTIPGGGHWYTLMLWHCSRGGHWYRASVGPGLDYTKEAVPAASPELCLAKDIEIAMSFLQSERVIKIQFWKKDDADKMSHFSSLEIYKNVPFIIPEISGQLHRGEHPGPHGGGDDHGGGGDQQRGRRQRLSPLQPLREAVQT